MGEATARSRHYKARVACCPELFLDPLEEPEPELFRLFIECSLPVAILQSGHLLSSPSCLSVPTHSDSLPNWKGGVAGGRKGQDQTCKTRWAL